MVHILEATCLDYKGVLQIATYVYWSCVSWGLCSFFDVVIKVVSAILIVFVSFDIKLVSLLGFSVHLFLKCGYLVH